MLLVLRVGQIHKTENTRLFLSSSIIKRNHSNERQKLRSEMKTYFLFFAREVFNNIHKEIETFIV